MGLLVFSWIFCALSRKVAKIQVTFLWPSMVGQTLTKEILLKFLQSKTLHVIKLQTSHRVIPNTIRIFEWNLTKWFYGLISILFMTVTHRNRSRLRWESLSFQDEVRCKVYYGMSPFFSVGVLLNPLQF